MQKYSINPRKPADSKNAVANSDFTEESNQVVHNSTDVPPFKQAWIAQVTPAEREEVWYVNICVTEFETVLVAA
ncbi:MAG TPA: hypothetical protein VK249_19185 [Anaerolineales bacterium]|nr:hypothetical protein [Anaerolineales bacterium]